MKLKELKEFLNTLTEDQLNIDAVVQGVDRVIVIDCLEITNEDYYYNEEYPEEGCFTKSDMGEDFDEETMKIALPKGSALISGDY